jgi:hypothetical protein
MPGNPKECRANAVHCLKRAAAASSPVTRDSFEALAKNWLKLATEIEATDRLLREWSVGEASAFDYALVERVRLDMRD